MNDITKWVCEWLAAHYRKDCRCNFYWRVPDGQWSWQQHVNPNESHWYMVITAGNSAYEFSLKSEHVRFHAEGKR